MHRRGIACVNGEMGADMSANRELKSWHRRAQALLIPVVVSLVCLPAAVAPIVAQQVSGAPGSPAATTTIEGNQLPPATGRFGGVIKEGARESTPWWPPRVVPQIGRASCRERV